MRKGAAVVFGLAGLLGLEAGIPSGVWATHEPDHRFTVSGYVRDKEGRPVADVRVQVRDLRDQHIEPASTYTDGSGFFKAVIHLHNDNAGDPLQVTVKDDKAGLDETKKIRAEFDPTDKRSDRQARVDFGADPDKVSESGLKGPAETGGVNYWVYGAGGLLVSGAIGAAVAWSRRRKAQMVSTRQGKKKNR
jgi:hypothetical protein